MGFPIEIARGYSLGEAEEPPTNSSGRQLDFGPGACVPMSLVLDLIFQMDNVK